MPIHRKRDIFCIKFKIFTQIKVYELLMISLRLIKEKFKGFYCLLIFKVYLKEQFLKKKNLKKRLKMKKIGTNRLITKKNRKSINNIL